MLCSSGQPHPFLVLQYPDTLHSFIPPFPPSIHPPQLSLFFFFVLGSRCSDSCAHASSMYPRPRRCSCRPSSGEKMRRSTSSCSACSRVDLSVCPLTARFALKPETPPPPSQDIRVQGEGRGEQVLPSILPQDRQGNFFSELSSSAQSDRLLIGLLLSRTGAPFTLSDSDNWT
jgi:hypothetical protein